MARATCNSNTNLGPQQTSKGGKSIYLPSAATSASTTTMNSTTNTTSKSKSISAGSRSKESKNVHSNMGHQGGTGTRTRRGRQIEKKHGTLWFKDGTLVIRARSMCTCTNYSEGEKTRTRQNYQQLKTRKSRTNTSGKTEGNGCCSKSHNNEYVLFKVHQSTLEMHSPVFCNIFGLSSSLCGTGGNENDGSTKDSSRSDEGGDDLSLATSVLSLEEGLDGIPTARGAGLDEKGGEEFGDSEEEEEWTSVHEMYDGSPIVDVLESAEDWAEVLKLLYGDCFLISTESSSPNPNLELTLLRPMRLAKKYLMHKIIYQLSAAVLAQWPRSLLAYQNYVSGISAAIVANSTQNPVVSSKHNASGKINGLQTTTSCSDPPPHLEPAAAITLANEHETLKSILPIAFYMLSLRSPFVDYPSSSSAGNVDSPLAKVYLEGARWDLLSSSDMRRLYAGQANLRSFVWERLVRCSPSASEVVEVGTGGIVPDPPYMFLLPLFQASNPIPSGVVDTYERDAHAGVTTGSEIQAEHESGEERDAQKELDEHEQRKIAREHECKLMSYVDCRDPNCAEGRRMIRERIFIGYLNFQNRDFTSTGPLSNSEFGSGERVCRKGELVDLLVSGGGVRRKTNIDEGEDVDMDVERALQLLSGQRNGIKLCDVCVLAIRTWGSSGNGARGRGSGGGRSERSGRKSGMREPLRKGKREEVVWSELGKVFGFE